MLIEIPCVAHFARERDNIVTTDASGNGLGIILSQKQNDKAIRSIAFTNRYLKDDVKIFGRKTKFISGGFRIRENALLSLR